jgi:outer membrane protein TolC
MRKFLFPCIQRMLPLMLVPALGIAAEPQKLADPLTLPVALEYAGKAEQFDMLSASERLQQALAESLSATSDNDMRINVSGRLRRIGVSELGDPTQENDSLISLFVTKPLYDFGKTDGIEALSELSVELRELEQQYLVEQRQMRITQKFFDVLNADNEYLRHNEDLAIGFIDWDRARERLELGLSSTLEVLEKQAAYERIRQNRLRAENLQRMTRVLLVEELGFPGQPPSEVAVPELRASGTIGDDVERMVKQAFKHSLLMKIQQKKVDIAMQAIEVASHTSGPTLEAELEISDYAKDGPNRDDWRASIYFDIPLYDGSRETSAIRIARARYNQALAELEKVRSAIRIEVLKLWQEIRQNSLRLEGELVNQSYRDLALDRARTEYQLEFKADLGDSMVEYSNSRMLAYQARYALEMSWVKLEKLLGEEFLKELAKTGGGNG